MSPAISLLISLPVIVWLWKRDNKARPKFSPATWIVLFWLLILGSHPLSFWLGIRIGSSNDSGDLEGNVFDRIVFLTQIALSIFILSKRGFRWGLFFGKNQALVLFYLFLAISAFWAPYPFVCFRRWTKEIGTLPVCLLLLTEVNWVEAARATYCRCAYVLFPMSVIVIKYFPSIGRVYAHQGGATYTGVTGQKNSLGEIVLVFGLFLLAELAQRKNNKEEPQLRKTSSLPSWISLATGVWLLITCDSKTSLLCLAIGSLIIFSEKLPLLRGNPKRTVAVFLVAAPSFFLLDSALDLSGSVLELLGRDRSLTERTDIWEGIKEQPVSPIVGAGYMMYWEIYKGVDYGTKHFDVKSAHNGYLETYLDGGLLECGFLAILMFFAGRRVLRLFLEGSAWGRLALAYFVMLLIYNVSESVFARRSPLWFSFLLLTIDSGQARFRALSRSRNEDIEKTGTRTHEVVAV